MIAALKTRPRLARGTAVFVLLAVAACTPYTPGGPGSRLALFQGLAIGLAILALGVAAVGYLMSRDSKRRPRASTIGVGSAPVRSAAALSRIGRIVALARHALDASAVLYFDVDEAQGRAVLRQADAEAPLVDGASVPLTADPFAFVVERRRSFYITDFKGLLWELPYYAPDTRVGTLLAVPVFTGDALRGVLVAEKTETQAFTAEEPSLLEGFAGVLADSLDAR